MKAQRHFTLLMAWRRYADSTTSVGAAGASGTRRYGYAQFCALFADYVRTNDLVATLHHEPGRAMLVDWAGDTIDVVDAASGEVTRAVLFVAVLPYSGALFCRAYLDMKSPSWLDAHVRAFAFVGGVTQIVVPDNPTTSTHQRHKGEAERVVNARYQQLADHYQTAVVPARARKPRDKAAAENAVNVVNKRVIGYLEGEVWTTLAELNDAIEERVGEVNHDLRRADGTTRWEVFTGEEQPLLAALPATRFEEVEWKECKAGRNYHLLTELTEHPGHVPGAGVGRRPTVCAHVRGGVRVQGSGRFAGAGGGVGGGDGFEVGAVSAAGPGGCPGRAGDGVLRGPVGGRAQRGDGAVLRDGSAALVPLPLGP